MLLSIQPNRHTALDPEPSYSSLFCGSNSREWVDSREALWSREASSRTQRLAHARMRAARPQEHAVMVSVKRSVAPERCRKENSKLESTLASIWQK